MEYIELTCTYNATIADLGEILVAELSEIGFESFTEEANELKAYIQKSFFNEKQLSELYVTRDPANGVNLSLREIAQQNWNHEWESNFSPVEVGSTCIVRAPFHEAGTGYKYDIVIEPKMSFGTGHHETTQLMLEAIAELDCEGKRVVDCGCGTGVLAILAAMRGASFVKGFDVEPWACENTEENFKRNGVTRYAVECKGVESIENEQYDIVIANINRNILLGSMKQFSESLPTGGILLLSGFYTQDIDIIKTSAQTHGLSYDSFRGKNNWVACTFEKRI